MRDDMKWTQGELRRMRILNMENIRNTWNHGENVGWLLGWLTRMRKETKSWGWEEIKLGRKVGLCELINRVCNSYQIKFKPNPTWEFMVLVVKVNTGFNIAFIHILVDKIFIPLHTKLLWSSTKVQERPGWPTIVLLCLLLRISVCNAISTGNIIIPL